MNRLSSLLALSAIVVAGTFAGAVLPASASGVSANFTIHNGDATYGMIRTGQSSNISGLSNPAATIVPGYDDPSSGTGLFSGAALTNNGQHVDGYVVYARAINTQIGVCTFNLRITRTNPALYVLHAWVGESGTNCTVPGDVSNSTGVFTGAFSLAWQD